MNRRLYILLLLAMLSISSAQDETSTLEWQSSQIVGGGYALGLETSHQSTSRLYCHIDIGGIYRSDNGGQSWTMLNEHLPVRQGVYQTRSIHLDPQDEDHIIALVGSQWASPLGLFRSEDAGNNWQQVLELRAWGNGPNRMDGKLIVADPLNSNTIYVAGVGDGVWKSTDNGKTWSNSGLLGIHPTDIKHDGRSLWVCASPIHFNNKQYGGGFYKSRDHGESWQKLSNNSPSQITIGDAKAGTIYGIFKHSQINKSTDGGITWEDYSEGLPYKRDARSNPISEGRFHAITYARGKLFVGNASGQIFSRKDGSNKFIEIPHKTVSIGDWWGAVNPSGRKYSHFGAAMSSLTVHPLEPEKLFFTDWYGVYQSNDDGKNWVLSIDGIESSYIHNVLSMDSPSQTVLLGSADNGLFVSHNSGISFSRKKWHLGNNIKQVVKSSTEQHYYAIGSEKHHSNRIFKSYGNLNDWIECNYKGLPDRTRSSFNSITASANDAQRLYLAVSGGVGKTSGGIFTSENGGRSWQSMNDGLPKGVNLFSQDIFERVGMQVAINTQDDLLCISRKHNSLFRKNANSQNWVAIDLALKIKPYSVVAAPGLSRAFYVTSDQGIFLIRNETHKQLCAQNSRHLAINGHDISELAFVDASGMVWHSTDSGKTWTELEAQPPHCSSKNTIAFSNGNLLVGTDGSGVFHLQL